MSRVGATCMAIIVAILVSILTKPAKAHDWYPRECCSGKDCGAVNDPREVSEDGAWYVYRGIRFRKDATKPSPDDLYHVCLVPPQGFGSQPFIRCMWRPSPGA